MAAAASRRFAARPPAIRKPGVQKVEAKRAITGDHVDVRLPVVNADDRMRQHPPRRFHMLRV